jgi:hypothetical protein
MMDIIQEQATTNSNPRSLFKQQPSDNSGDVTSSAYTTPENDPENPASNNDKEDEKDSKSSKEEDEQDNADKKEDEEDDDDDDESSVLDPLWKCLEPCIQWWNNFTAVFSYKLDDFIGKRVNQFLVVLVLMLLVVLIMAPLFHSMVQDEYFDPRYYMDERQNDTIPFHETLWEVYAMLMDPGTHVEMENWPARIFSILISWIGVVIFSILVGFVIDAVMEKMEDLKKGKSTVVETEHTLILGWTDKSAGLCRELADANSSEGGGIIVVLDPLDKEELEQIYANQVRPQEMIVDGAKTTVVFRSGSALRGADLRRVSATNARSIVILSDYGQDPDLADADILRVILTLQTLDKDGEDAFEGHIVCEVRDVDNEPLVALVGGDNIETVVSHDIIGSLMLMAARQPGIARVFDSILGFEGDEFYTGNAGEDGIEWEELYGLEFQDVVMRFPDAVPIGYVTVDEKGGSHVELNPNKSHIMDVGENVIFIAEDDDTYAPEVPLSIQVSTTIEPIIPMGDPEKILFCGWRRDIRDMMLQLDSMLAPGSELHMLNEKPADVKIRSKLLLDDGFNPNELQNMKLIHWYGNSAIKRHLNAVPLDEFSTIMILADESRENDMMHSDSHSLSSLLLIRDLQKLKRRKKRKALMQGNKKLADRLAKWTKAKELKCAVVCEILDSQTQETISGNEQVSLSSDFVQSNKMISQIIAMVSEDRNVKHILKQLLGTAGANVMVKSSRMYCSPNEELSFMQLQKRAMRLDKILLGYQDHIGNGETVVNPKDKYKIKNWDNIDIIYLEGHSELENIDEELAEEVVHAFQKTADDRVAQELEDNSELSMESKLERTLSAKLEKMFSQKLMEVRPEFDMTALHQGRHIEANNNSEVLELLATMNLQLGSLTSQNKKLHEEVRALHHQVDDLGRE